MALQWTNLRIQSKQWAKIWKAKLCKGTTWRLTRWDQDARATLQQTQRHDGSNLPSSTPWSDEVRNSTIPCVHLWPLWARLNFIPTSMQPVHTMGRACTLEISRTMEQIKEEPNKHGASLAQSSSILRTHHSDRFTRVSRHQWCTNSCHSVCSSLATLQDKPRFTRSEVLSGKKGVSNTKIRAGVGAHSLKSRGKCERCPSRPAHRISLWMIGWHSGPNLD